MIYFFAVALFIGSNALSPPDDNLDKAIRVLDDLQKTKEVAKDNNLESKCDRGNYFIFLYDTPQ